MSNLVFRLLTAVIAVPIILGLLYWLHWWAFGVLAFLAAAIAALEYFQMTHKGDRLAQVFGLLLTLGLFSGLVLTNFGATNSFLTLLLTLSVVPSALLFTLFRPGDQSTAFFRMATLGLGPIYIGSLLASIASLRRIGAAEIGAPLGVNERIGAGLVVLALMVAWFSDTAGYFVGRSVKGPKLYPSVSPNKTWSGAIGGLFGSALGAVLAHFVYLPQLPLVNGVVIAVIAGALGQAGDLCESLMKRSVGVKDSGGILPGHGGILDRVDALMFVGLVLYVTARTGLLGLQF